MEELRAQLQEREDEVRKFKEEARAAEEQARAAQTEASSMEQKAREQEEEARIARESLIVATTRVKEMENEVDESVPVFQPSLTGKCRRKNKLAHRKYSDFRLDWWKRKSELTLNDLETVRAEAVGMEELLNDNGEVNELREKCMAQEDTIAELSQSYESSSVEQTSLKSQVEKMQAATASMREDIARSEQLTHSIADTGTLSSITSRDPKTSSESRKRPLKSGILVPYKFDDNERSENRGIINEARNRGSETEE